MKIIIYKDSIKGVDRDGINNPDFNAQGLDVYLRESIIHFEDENDAVKLAKNNIKKTWRKVSMN